MRPGYKVLTSGVLLCALLLSSLQGVCGTIQGSVQNAQAGPIKNGTFTFTLNAPATVAGTASVVTTTVSCWTDQNGQVVGEPNGTGNSVPGGAAPSLSVNLGAGTLPAGTYFVQLWFFDATGESFASPEGTINLAGPGTLIVNHPTISVPNATGYRVGIGATSGSETLQGSVTGTSSNFSQSTTLAAGSALPVSNTTACKIRFNDELTPSFTCYDTNLIGTNGLPVPGFPQWWYVAGGSAGTVNISSGTPQSNVCQGQGIVYPQAVLTLPPFNATQTINGPLNLNGFGLTAGLSTFAGVSNSANYALANTGLVKWGTDTGLSRDSAGVVDVGNGTQGDKSGNLKLATVTLGKSDGTLPATFTNDTAGGINFTSNSGKVLELNTQAQVVFFGAVSGTTILAPTGVASGTLTLPAATDTLIGKATTDTLTGKGFGDKIALYNNIATVSNGVPSILAAVDTTGLQANVSATTLYAVPASGAGLYEISAYTKLTVAGSVSSTIPEVLIASTDADDSTVGIQMPCTPNGAGQGMGQIAGITNNTVNLSLSGVCVINAKASTNIQYLTSGYASNAAGMTYSLHIRLKKL